MEIDQKDKKQAAKYMRFSSVGFQMAVIIGGFAWLGTYLDGRTPGKKTPWWTLGLTLFGVVAGIYLMIKEVIKISKENDA